MVNIFVFVFWFRVFLEEGLCFSSNFKVRRFRGSTVGRGERERERERRFCGNAGLYLQFRTLWILGL